MPVFFFSKTWQIDIIFRVARRHTRRQYVKRILSCSSTDITRMFHSQAVTNLKTADAFSMATLCRMTKIQDTAPDNRSCATDHKHQTRNSATEHNQPMHLANYHEWRKRTIKQLKCILQIITFSSPQNLRAFGSVRRTLYGSFPQTFGRPSFAARMLLSRCFNSCIFFRSSCYVNGSIFVLNNSLISSDTWRRCW